MAERREKGTGSIVKLKDGTYLAKMSQGKKPDGKPNIKRRRAKTEAEAKKKLKEIIKEFKEEERRTTTNFNEVTVPEYFDQFLEYKKLKLESTSYRRLESTIDEHIKKDFEYTFLKDLDEDLIQNQIIKAYENGLSHSSVKKIYDAFKACFDYATNIKKDIRVYDNPMLAVQMIPEKKFKKKRTEPRYFLNEENNNERERFIVEALRKYKTGRYVYSVGPIFVFLLNTGLREGEMCGLSRDNIFLEEKYINICDTAVTVKEDGKYVTKVRTNNTKYFSKRYVPMNDQALEMMKIMMEEFPPIKQTDRLLYTKNNRVISPASLIKPFNRICQNAGIEDMDGVGLHCLRHTFATSLFENKVDIKVISELLGHTGTQVTERVYVSVINKLKIEAVKIPTKIE